ncbi:MAG: hypothetical protein HYZ15_15380 [Sphingobacteriales bacterium]|nr:hypothetical protein [Sphingobacteriales bacterium]
MKKQLLFLFTLSLFFSCRNGSGKIDGGPCSYRETLYPAKLIRLETKDSLRYEAYFELEAGLQSAGKKDTVSYEVLNYRPVTAEEVRKDSLAEGSICRYVIRDIISGSCTPRVIQLQLEKY